LNSSSVQEGKFMGVPMNISWHSPRADHAAAEAVASGTTYCRQELMQRSLKSVAQFSGT
jgi:hypothetical protein